MDRKKKTLVIISILMMGVLASMSDEINNKIYVGYYKKELKETMKKLEEKYGRKFVAQGYEEADFLSDVDTVFCYEEGMNPEYDVVNVWISKENGHKVYRDNYFGYIIRPEVEELVTEIVETEFEDVKVYMYNRIAPLPNELTSGNTLEDLFEKNEDFVVETYMYIKGDPDTPIEEYETKMKAVEQRFQETGKSFWNVIFIVSEEVYDDMDRYKQEEFNDLFPGVPKADGVNCFYKCSHQLFVEANE